MTAIYLVSIMQSGVAAMMFVAFNIQYGGRNGYPLAVAAVALQILAAMVGLISSLRG